MKLLIVGRSGSGKDTLAGYLIKHGLTQVLSYTTRPKRYADEATHVFISDKDAADYTDRVAETKINGYEYFATRQQVMDADIYIVDPKGFYQLIHNMPETNFVCVYMSSNREEARRHAINRASDPVKEAAVWDARTADEDRQFCDFEEALNKELEYPNCRTVWRFTNDYTEGFMENTAKQIVHALREVKNLLHMTEVLKTNGSLDSDANGNIRIVTKGLKTEWVSPDNFVGILMADSEGRLAVCDAYLARTDLIK